MITNMSVDPLLQNKGKGQLKSYKFEKVQSQIKNRQNLADLKVTLKLIIRRRTKLTDQSASLN